ncbi:hypothetical protein TBLA_0B06530 [Henningerozyma blattae CBS 6284]|uniref:Phosphatidylinositol transfer protein SFH5 n=1 Tax=Henningerozyma blattae (strain ATCC 34711 / CBS 6284 / DSM 70876 / NBRC 10599 / NRRL Y-10934 / UCD 77-7) TaxID=1071380 RepID=I2GZC4_HENB6|nr:hypothetical protein TBLA_0B06530 [Tetrapisispora blattae CBS 6284]CCH59476.1 hypothetical protein TBLA_0B06530 [Tetrapisispora blattae CBS 6284]
MKFQTDEQEKVYEKVYKELPAIIEKKCSGYDELYGYKLNYGDKDKELVTKYFDESIARALIFKLCKAYDFKYDDVKTHIIDILNWRKKFNPLDAAFKEKHNETLQTIGLVTHYPTAKPNKQVITWNLYGAISGKKEYFKDVDAFVRYRVGLMERGLRLLDFENDDNSYMAQVHDYKGVSMFKMDSDTKKCTRQVIAIFQEFYPELLSSKYFINVPSILVWVFDVIKTFVDSNTKKKFVLLGDGKKLGSHLPECPSKDYGGEDTKNTLQQQSVGTPRPTEYTLYLFEKENNDIE